jgi:hypothetical protein
MKKLALVLLVGLSFASTTNAQFKFGVKAGANFSTFSGKDADGAQTLVGFNGGVFAGLGLADHLSLQPELVYSLQGAKENDGQGGTATQTANYLNIPVLLKYRFPMGLFIETGPQIGFILSGKVKDQGVSVDDKNVFKSTDFSWALGAGFHIPTTELAVDVRYNFGLSSIAADQSGTSFNVKNGVFQVGLMYTLFSTDK